MYQFWSLFHRKLQQFWLASPTERSVQAADELERERRELAAYLTHEMLGETKRRVFLEISVGLWLVFS